MPPMAPSASLAAVFPLEFRTMNGAGNNSIDPTLGAANTPFLRNTTIAYGDGKSTPAGATQKGTREISNLISAQSASIPIRLPESAYWWGWGQFLDHDMNLTPIANPLERFNIPVPLGDPVFDPSGTGTAKIAFQRSAFC